MNGYHLIQLDNYAKHPSDYLGKKIQLQGTVTRYEEKKIGIWKKVKVGNLSDDGIIFVLDPKNGEFKMHDWEINVSCEDSMKIKLEGLVKHLSKVDNGVLLDVHKARLMTVR